jgi:hypothetical protein
MQVPTEGDNEEPVKPLIVLQTFKKYGDPLALSRTLQIIKPLFVIMYDADITAVRRLEVRICCEVYCDCISCWEAILHDSFTHITVLILLA